MGFSSELLREIENCEKEILDINYCDLSNSEEIKKLVDVLNKNNTIKTLRLYQCHVNDEGAKELARVNYLIELDLSGNEVGSDGTVFLSKNKYIKKLNLGGNRICISGAQALAESNTIQELILGECALGDAGAKTILSSKNKALVKLDLSTNEITDDAFVELLENKTLQELNLLQNYIGDKGIEVVANKLVGLTLLNAGTNLVGDNGAKALSNHQALKIINLSQNQVGEEGFRVLCQNKALITLDLHGNKVRFNLNDPLHADNSIEEINLTLNQIEDKPEKPLESITSFPKLKKLDLQGNNITEQLAGDLYKEFLTKHQEKENFELHSNGVPLLFSLKRKKMDFLEEEITPSKVMRLSFG